MEDQSGTGEYSGTGSSTPTSETVLQPKNVADSLQRDAQKHLSTPGKVIVVPEPEKQRELLGHHWKPGESGNPKGRPHKGRSLTEQMRELLHENPEKRKALIERVLNQALGGDIASQKLVWNYLDGMPMQKVEMTEKPALKLLDDTDTPDGADDEPATETDAGPSDAPKSPV